MYIPFGPTSGPTGKEMKHLFNKDTTNNALFDILEKERNISYDAIQALDDILPLSGDMLNAYHDVRDNVSDNDCIEDIGKTYIDAQHSIALGIKQKYTDELAIIDAINDLMS